MARVTIEQPDQYSYSTEIEVYSSMINRGHHLGNDSMVGLLNEARGRYIQARTGVDHQVLGHQMIMADLAVIYRSEAQHREVLVFEVEATEFSRRGLDLVYRVSEKSSGREVAIAKTAMLLYDYKNNGLVEVDPEAIKAAFAA